MVGYPTLTLVLLQFADLETAAQENERRRLIHLIEQMWIQVQQDSSRVEDLIAGLDDRLVITRDSMSGGFVVRHLELEARPLAELVAKKAPGPVPATVGLPPGSHEHALIAVQDQCGMDLSRSRVRVGFSRGHLLDVVILVPLDIDADPFLLDSCAATYLEHRLGESLLDTWVADVGTARIRRTSGLSVISDVRSEAPSYSLDQAGDLVQRGINGLLGGLRRPLFSTAGDSWAALEVPTTDQGLQPDRCFASSRCPEALKSALEGLPFDSRRFALDGELFVWFRARAADSTGDRTERRLHSERLLASAEFSDCCLFAGSGFGEESDYIDAWVLPDIEVLRRLGNSLAKIWHGVELGFYDTRFGAERAFFPG